MPEIKMDITPEMSGYDVKELQSVLGRIYEHVPVYIADLNGSSRRLQNVSIAWDEERGVHVSLA